jgi:hypothetical protein
MAYSDEWWKGKHAPSPNLNAGCPESNSSLHSNCGYPADSHPDEYSNEEWWGIMRTKDNGTNPDIMEPRAVYYSLQSLWMNNVSASPVVSSPSSNQSSLPTDTDNTPLWGETARLNVTVTDDVGVASVTVDLSEIGGAQDAVMINIGENVYSAVTNASASTSPKLYNMTVNATDTSGNSNTSVSIQLKVMKNGDCTGNNIVNIGDAMRLANNVSYSGNPVYALSSPYVCEVTGNGMINIGDALRLANNVSYPGNPAYVLK